MHLHQKIRVATKDFKLFYNRKMNLFEDYSELITKLYNKPRFLDPDTLETWDNITVFNFENIVEYGRENIEMPLTPLC